MENTSPKIENPKIIKSKKGRHWTEAEIIYLRNAIAQNFDISLICEQLGRTYESIISKRYHLELGVKFKHDKSIVFSPGILELQSHVPIPRKGEKGSKYEKVHIKLRELFEVMQPGQSFVVPKEWVNITLHLAKRQYREYKLITKSERSENGERKFCRFFRIK